MPFYKFPKALLQDSCYDALPDDAKMLYAALFDRMMLSSVNHWRDEFGRIYVIFSNRSLCELFHWSHDKVSRMMSKLEEFTGRTLTP